MVVAMICVGESLCPVAIQAALVNQAVMSMAPVKCHILWMEVIATAAILKSLPIV
jgi:hypothetical protein